MGSLPACGLIDDFCTASARVPAVRSRAWSGLFAVVVLAAGCSSAGDESTSSLDLDLTAEVGAISIATTEDEVDAPPIVPGAPLNPFDLRAGMCFNEGSWFDEVLERRVELTASVACTEEHEREVYFEAEFPAPAGAPFPGDTKMAEWSTELCYNAFEDFVGVEYERSAFEIDFIQPTEATFEHEIGRHRRVTCLLFDLSGEPKVGTARNSGL